MEKPQKQTLKQVFADSIRLILFGEGPEAREAIHKAKQDWADYQAHKKPGESWKEFYQRTRMAKKG